MSDRILDSARLVSMADAGLQAVVREFPGVDMDINNKTFTRMNKPVHVILNNMEVSNMEAEFEYLESLRGADILCVNLLERVVTQALYGWENGAIVITTRPGYTPAARPLLNMAVFTALGYQRLNFICRLMRSILSGERWSVWLTIEKQSVGILK